ncbi:hypothetical protein TNCV_712941 [Trichonephila clavipes]|nr:hypothetical protein TNCV_712941 [Trichonephila clavipes]
MDDNARPHRANIADEFLQSEDVTHMDWPAYSPDLNPIEHVLASSSFKLKGCPIRSPKRSQMYSIGDKSGAQAGQGRILITQRQSCDTLAV